MTIAYTKGAKRRNKVRQAMPELAAVPKREKDGRAKRAVSDGYERDASVAVLKTRARHMGRDTIDDMKNPALGEEAGKAIFAACGGGRDGDGNSVAERLWSAYAGLTAAEAAYAKHYLGLRLHAKTAKVEYLTEVFEARPDDQPDTRSEDEKSRDAANRWARWRGYAMQLPRHQERLIFDVAYGRGPEVMGMSGCTAHGRRFVDAVEALAEIVERST